MSVGPVETLEFLKPRAVGDGDCSIYACEERAFAVLRVGGGATSKDVHTSSVRFCLRHFHALRSRADRFAAVAS